MTAIKSANIIHRVDHEEGGMRAAVKILDDETGITVAESISSYKDVSKSVATHLSLDKAYELARDHGFDQVNRVFTNTEIYY